MPKPIIPHQVPLKKPVVTVLPINKWLFSFKEFNQISGFGFSTTDASWFSSLFNRLKDISNYTPNSFKKDIGLQSELRYHPIDWNSKNIPIERKDLDWIDKNVIDNEEEFVFYQFHISKALGRVVGYWQENVFNIVLIDPMHNMQPSKCNNYKIRKSIPVCDDLTNYIFTIEQIRNIHCSDVNCKVKESLMNVRYTKKDSNAVICFLDDSYLDKLEELSERYSLTDLIEMGILLVC